jgi:cytochrome b561
MALRSTATAWGGLARLFHWAMPVLFATTIPLGWYMSDLPLGAHKVRLYALHKSIGLTLLALTLLRLAWRLAERRPALPPMPRWQARAAGATHAALYALMFAIPLSGWLYNSAAGFPLRWFGLVNLPALTASNPALKPLAHGIHATAVWVLLALVALHVAAALKHHVVDRDRTLALMVPGLRVPGGGEGR